MAMDMSVAMRIAASVSGGSSVDDLRKSVEKLNGSANNIQGAFKTAGMAIKGFIGLEAIRRTADYAMGLFTAADALDELAQRTGVSAEMLSKLEQSAKMSGVSIEGVANGMKKLSVNLVEAQNGSKDAMKGFQALRLDPRQFRTSEEALAAIADRFKDMQDGANKVAIANALMGKSGEANIPWLNQGADAMRRYSAVFSPEFIGMSAKFTDLVDEMGYNFRRSSASVLEKFLPTMNQVLQSFNDLTASKGDVVGFLDLIAEAFRQIGAMAQIVIGALRQVLELINTAFTASALVFEGNMTGAVDRIKQGYQNILDVGNQAVEQFKKLQKDSLIFGQGTTSEILARQRDGAGANTAPGGNKGFGADMSVFNKAAEGEMDRIQKFKQAQEAAIQKRRDELDAVNMSTVEFQKLTAARELETKAADLAIGMSDASKEKLREVTEELKAQSAAMIELEYSTKRTFEYGAKEAFKNYIEEAGNMAKQTNDVFTKAFKGIEDALTNFVTTGKLNFKDLANSIIQDLIRIAIRTAVMKPILGSIGISAFANGGIMTGAGEVPLRKYAAGGIANSPQLAMFGEGSQPEAYVPLPDGRTIPVTMSGGGSTNNVTVNVSVDGSSSNMQSSGTQAAQLGNAVSKAVQSEILKQQRPGGLLYAR